jgi:hypothetical protein
MQRCLRCTAIALAIVQEQRPAPLPFGLRRRLLMKEARADADETGPAAPGPRVQPAIDQATGFTT